MIRLPEFLCEALGSRMQSRSNMCAIKERHDFMLLRRNSSTPNPNRKKSGRRSIYLVTIIHEQSLPYLLVFGSAKASSMARKYKSIIFDLGGVLLQWDKSSVNDLSAAQFTALLNSTAWHDLDRGELSVKEACVVSMRLRVRHTTTNRG